MIPIYSLVAEEIAKAVLLHAFKFPVSLLCVLALFEINQENTVSNILQAQFSPAEVMLPLSLLEQKGAT